MMESRRCANPTLRSGEIQEPAPSGPRWTIVSRMRARYSAVTSKLLFLNASTPEIPHICRYQVGLLEQIRAQEAACYILGEGWKRQMGNNRLRIMSIVGARPNMMKVAPLMAELRQHEEIEPVLVHTGQHYDYSMSQVFFDQLRVPPPDYNLGVGSGTHYAQTAEIMRKFGELVQQDRPDMVLVAGDVNSTIACALVAAKERIPVAHVEAGLRSFDRTMPEEINRILTDALSDLLFTTEESANRNLANEGVAPGKVFFVGNLMIDSLVRALKIPGNPRCAPSWDWMTNLTPCSRSIVLRTWMTEIS